MISRVRNRIIFNNLTDDVRNALFIVGICATKILGYAWREIIGDSSNFQIASKVIQFAFLMLAVKTLYKKRTMFIFIEIVFLLLFLLSYILGYASYENLQEGWIYIAGVYVPMFIATYSITNKDLFMTYLYRMSWIIFFPLILAVYTQYVETNFQQYDMYLGYALLIPILCFLSKFQVTYAWINLVLAVVGSFCILLFASRGPLLCILCYIALSLLFSKRVRFRIKIFYLITCGSVGILITTLWDSILNKLYHVLKNVGITSRTLLLLMSGDVISHIGSRDKIQEDCMKLLSKSPIFGCGVESAQSVIGTYPHNIFIELLLSFGYPLGIIFIILLIMIALRGIVHLNKSEQELCIIFLSYCTSLFVSGTYLDTWQFFVFLGLAVSGKTIVNVKLNRHKHNKSVYMLSG